MKEFGHYRVFIFIVMLACFTAAWQAKATENTSSQRNEGFVSLYYDGACDIIKPLHKDNYANWVFKSYDSNLIDDEFFNYESLDADCFKNVDYKFAKSAILTAKKEKYDYNMLYFILLVRLGEMIVSKNDNACKEYINRNRFKAENVSRTNIRLIYAIYGLHSRMDNLCGVGSNYDLYYLKMQAEYERKVFGVMRDPLSRQVIYANARIGGQ